MVRYLTTNGKSGSYGTSHPFALRYRRANGTFYNAVQFEAYSTLASLFFLGGVAPPASPWGISFEG